MMMIINFLLNFTNIFDVIRFLIKLLTLGILVSTVRAVVEAKLEMLGILPLLHLI